MKIDTLVSMINDMEDGVTDFTDNGKCIGCGNCCSDLLPIMDREIVVIKKYIKTNNIKESKTVYPFAFQPTVNLMCPFRDNVNRKCTIYEVRPEICRQFKCDLTSKGKRAEMKKFSQEINFVSMRKTFFGDAK